MDYPIFRKIVWKPFYEILAKKFRILDWHFMNYGYAFDPGAPVLHLRPNDEINRYPIQLYHYLATKTNIEGKEILEVGCGRGGGSRYINSYLNPRHVTALDIASNAIKWAKQHHKDKDLLFIQGDAQKLPFADGAFEVVLNVESCHAYPSVPKFLAEVKRILKPSGFFFMYRPEKPCRYGEIEGNLTFKWHAIRIGRRYHDKCCVGHRTRKYHQGKADQ